MLSVDRRITIDLDRDALTGKMQVSINSVAVNGGSDGYRLLGPKYLGRSEQVARAEVTARDAEEIRAYLDLIPRDPYWERQAATGHIPTRPIVVCLCGSTRFAAAFRAANLRETLAGRIVLSIGCDTRADADLAARGELGQDLAATKAMLDELHLRKIDLADEVLVLNVGGYAGESTAREIAYAVERGKAVRYLEPDERDAEEQSW